MDLSAFEVPDVVPFPIKDTQGNDTGIVFQLAGPAHEKRLAYERQRAKEVLKDFNKSGGKATIKETVEELFERDTERLVALTLDWTGVESEGATLPFSADAARTLYNNRRSSVRSQVSAALTSIANFIPLP